MNAAPSKRLESRGGSRSADLRLAALHLRLGSIALAWAELEAAHAEAPLPAHALADLAEARWRSGDLAAAGEAANAALALGVVSPVAAVIAVEARLAGTTGDDAGADVVLPAIAAEELDRIFAGMPRSPVWPPDTTTPRSEGTAVPEPDPASASGDPRADGGRADPEAAGQPPRPDEDAAAELAAAAADLEAGEQAGAAIRLALLLRTSPTTAAAVAELLEAPVDPADPALDIARGDALQLLGRSAEAELAWARASTSLLRRSAPELPAQAAEATTAVGAREPDLRQEDPP
jgi:hypothetical protein